MKYFLKISVVFFSFTSPHYPFTFNGEIGLIGTNCSTTAQSIVLPVASGTCAACCTTQTIWGTKAWETVEHLVPAIVLFSHSLILLKACCGLSCLGTKCGRNQEARILQYLDAHQLFSVPLLHTGCAGLSEDRAKGHHPPCLFKAWCPFSVRSSSV